MLAVAMRVAEIAEVKNRFAKDAGATVEAGTGLLGDSKAVGGTGRTVGAGKNLAEKAHL